MLIYNPAWYVASGVFYCLSFLASSLLNAASAETASPFYTRDQNPLVMIYGLPTPVSAKIIHPGQSRLHTSLNLSNTINGERTASEALFVDVESYQLNLIYDYGMHRDWMLRLQLPFIKHHAGFMDNWIDSYHDLLSLPEDIRPFYPTDQMDIRYSENDTQLLSLQQSSSGIGDVSLQTAYQARASEDFYLSYWVSLKLPSGDSTKLTGSDATDLAVWLALDHRLVNDMWVFGNFGSVFMGNSKVLPAQHKDYALFATTGMQFHPWKPVQLKFQLDMHSAFYDSSTDFLGSVIQLTFGGTVLLSKLSSLDVAVAEDIQTGASPDVNFNITWRRLF